MAVTVMCAQVVIRDERDVLVFVVSKKSASLLFSIDPTCAVWCQEKPKLLIIYLHKQFAVDIISILITRVSVWVCQG